MVVEEAAWQPRENREFSDQKTLQKCEALWRTIEEPNVDIAAVVRLSPLPVDADMQALWHIQSRADK